ncbi:MAG: rod-binding protein [Oligoflexales bacterium]|nr:rod-binding protein [Oligoflexales bacterium]
MNRVDQYIGKNFQALGLNKTQQASPSEPTSIEVDAKDARQRTKFRESAQEFESMFLELVLKSMRDTVIKSELIDGGSAEDIYQSMLDQEYAKNMASTGITGLADVLEKQLMGSTTKDNSSLLSNLKTQGLQQYRAHSLPSKLE